MIAPRSRLLWAFALVALPAAALWTVAPWLAFVLVAFAALLLSDALLSLGRLAAVQVRSPELVRLSKSRPGAIALRLTNTGNWRLRLRCALDLPPEIVCAQDELLAELPPQQSVLATVGCTPAQRGRFALEKILIETSSRFGFWNIRQTFATTCELRVYPDLRTERQNLSAIFLHRGSPGARAIRRVGKGRDFEQLRDYVAGDSIEDVSWKATAKRGRPITKIYQVEQTQEVYVIVDASRLSARIAGGAPILEKFINCALILCLAAGQRNDFFGLTTFADKVQSFVRAKNGQAHYNLCRDTLYRLQPASVTPDFDDLFTFLRLHLRRRALLVFLTALDDPALAAAFSERIDLLSRQHLVLVNMLRPPEAQPLFARGAVGGVDEIYRQLGGHLVWHDLRELGRRLHHHGVELSLVERASLTSAVVAQYVRVKQRQLL